MKYPICLLIICLVFQTLKAQNSPLETTGDVLLFAFPLVTATTTFMKDDREGRIQFAKGFLVNQVLTLGLKQIIDKQRPDMSNFNSFPSGHTSTTFQSASFLQRRYGWKFGIPAYALAGLTSYSRINANRHDGWDLFAGALIGVGSTYLFTTPYQKEHLELTYSRIEDSHLIGFKFKF